MPHFGATVLQLIPIHRRDYGMLYTHQFYRLSHTSGFVQVIFRWATSSHGTERATPRADISEDHEGGSACAPAFAHVRAIAALANSMQFIFVNQFTHLGIFGANGQLHPQPIWLAFFGFFFGYDRKFDHGYWYWMLVTGESRNQNQF